MYEKFVKNEKQFGKWNFFKSVKRYSVSGILHEMIQAEEIVQKCREILQYYVKLFNVHIHT